MSRLGDIFLTVAATVAGFYLGGPAGAVQAAALVGGRAVANDQARRAERKRRQAQNDALEDRKLTTSGTAEPQQIVLGRTRASLAQAAPGWTHGTNSEYWSCPLTIAGHEVDAIEDVWFNEKTAGPWVTSGATRTATVGSDWYKGASRLDSFAAAGGPPGTTITVPGGATAFAVESIAHTNIYTSEAGDGATYINTGSNVLAPSVGYSYDRIGNDLVVTLLQQFSGLELTITYRVETGTGMAAVKSFLGLSSGERDTALETASAGQWTSAHLGKSIARVHVTLSYDPDIYVAGIPQMSAIVRGVRAYDPRLDSTNGGSGSQRFADPATWTWTRNPSLLWAWYMTWSNGGRRPSSKINWPSVIVAANACDESLPINGSGSVQARYTCDGTLSTAADVRTNVDKILSAMVGTRFYSGGQWYVRAGVYASPVMDLTEDDLAPGDISPQARPKRRDLFNSIRGIYVDGHAPGELGASDPGGFWSTTDFPQYASATYIAEDGEELWEDIELSMTQDWRRAQRIAKMMLFLHRQALTFTAAWKFKAVRLQPGDRIRYTSPTFGWTNKVFRVIDRQYEPHGDVALVLREDGPEVYSWDFNEAVTPDPAPNTLLPDPRIVRPLQNFKLSPGGAYTLPDGTLVAYTDATWDAITDSAVLSGGRIELWWKRAVDTYWRKQEIRASETKFRIEPVSGGDTLNVFVLVFNGSGAKSAIVTSTQALDATLPRNVAVPPLSSNLLKNATWQYGTGGWGVASAPGVKVGFETRYGPHITGVPSSATLWIESPLTGNNGATSYATDDIPVDPSAIYVAFCDLIGWNVAPCVSVQWLDGGRQHISYVDGNVVASVPTESATARPDRIDHYTRSRAVARPPSGARYARLLLTGNQNWGPADAFGKRYVFNLRPFFGEIAAGATEDPPWDAGGSPVLGTGALAPGAATDVFIVGGGSAVPFNGQREIEITQPAFTATDSGSLQMDCTFTVFMAGSGADQYQFRGSLGPLNPGTKNQGPLATLDVVGVGAFLIKTFTLTHSMQIAAGQTITPSLRVSRVPYTEINAGGVVIKPVVSYAAVGSVNVDSFRLNLVKR